MNISVFLKARKYLMMKLMNKEVLYDIKTDG